MSKEIKVEKIGGDEVVVIRDGKKVTGLSAKCTHRGCTVAYNKKEGSLDCPCHGSRFNLKGDVMEGPADAPLPNVDLKEEDGKLKLS